MGKKRDEGPAPASYAEYGEEIEDDLAGAVGVPLAGGWGEHGGHGKGREHGKPPFIHPLGRRKRMMITFIIAYGGIGFKTLEKSFLASSK